MRLNCNLRRRQAQNITRRPGDGVERLDCRPKVYERRWYPSEPEVAVDSESRLVCNCLGTRSLPMLEIRPASDLFRDGSTGRYSELDDWKLVWALGVMTRAACSSLPTYDLFSLAIERRLRLGTLNWCLGQRGVMTASTGTPTVPNERSPDDVHTGVRR